MQYKGICLVLSVEIFVSLLCVGVMLSGVRRYAEMSEHHLVD